MVGRLVELGAARQFQAQWVAAPSGNPLNPCPWYAKAAGLRGCSTSNGGLARALPLPPVPHEMLLTRFSAMKEPPVTTEQPAGAGERAGDGDGDRDGDGVADGVGDGAGDGAKIRREKEAPQH